jgi:VCBS repeat-containing protein
MKLNTAISVIVVLLLIATPMSVLTFGASAVGPAPAVPAFSGTGAGTVGDPYIITNVNQLQEMNNAKHAHYILGNDIDASATTGWNSGKGFEPIGGDPNRFSGSLDGHNHTITGLFINGSWWGNLGLFGVIGNGNLVQNVVLVDNNITGSQLVGGFVGYNEGKITNCHSTGSAGGTECVGGFVGFNNGNIANCSTTGSASGTNVSIGGFVGINYGIITNCHSTGSASGTEYVGGFVGENWGNVTKCYSTGSVGGTNIRVGGFTGMNRGAITKCYSTGSASGTIFVGGFFGDNWHIITNCYSSGSASGTSDVGGFGGGNAGTITNCYSTGSASAISFDVNGFTEGNSASITNCFWDVETGWVHSLAGTGKTTEEMKNHTTFMDAGWNFIDIWAIKNTLTYPFFIWNHWNDPPIASDDQYSTSEIVALSIAAPGVVANDEDPNLLTWPENLRDTLEVTDHSPVSAYGVAITVGADGSFIYDPTTTSAILALGPGEHLEDSFDYTIIDDGGETSTATVYVTVWGVNNAPTATDDVGATSEDAILNVPANGVLANDQDAEPGTLTVVPEAFTNANGAIIVINADGSYSYDPIPSATMQALAVGEWLHDSFTYTVIDAHSAVAFGTVTVNVTGANDAPGITTANVLEVVEGVAYSVDYDALDVDASDVLAWSLASNATWLTIVPATGVLSGTPVPGIFYANVSVDDGNGGVDYTNFTLTAYSDEDGDGTPDYMDPDFLTVIEYNNQTVWNNNTVNQTVWSNQTIPEYHNSTIWSNQTVPEYHNSTVWNNVTAEPETVTPVWAWGALVAAIVLGAVAVAMAVRKPGGKKPEEGAEPEQTKDDETSQNTEP